MDFHEYWRQLWTVKDDYNQEVYYDELVRPLFKAAAESMDGVKVIPTFSTRNYRSKSRKENYRCITGGDDHFVWPDHVFVPQEYSDSRPLPPYAKVELKMPNIERAGAGQFRYVPLEKEIKRRLEIEEIESELFDCALILTDGITWFFLEKQFDLDKLDKIELLDSQQIIRLVKESENPRYCPQSHSPIRCVELLQNKNEQFGRLKDLICTFINENKKESANGLQQDHQSSQN